ncbi:MAG: acyltransferase [Gammaproteobacteria bacterium]|nr:MAG: acyltransferase [Gammaproteobacteria bacterium]
MVFFATESMLTRLLRVLEHRTGIGEVMPALDSVRTIAIALVFGFHAHAFSGTPSLPLGPQGPDLAHLLQSGFLGVDLFFVLSGFLLILPWARAFYLGRPFPSPMGYYRRRILRIAPAYYAHLLVLFLVLVPWVYGLSFLLSGEGAWHVLAHAFFLQFLFPGTATGLGINGALWTLTIEAQFYLILPFVAPYFLGRRAWLGLGAALGIAIAWKALTAWVLADMALAVMEKTHPLWYDPFSTLAYAYPLPMVQMFLDNQFPAQAFHFAIGMACGNLYASHRYGRSTMPWMEGYPGGLMGLLAGATLLWMAWTLDQLDMALGFWRHAWHPLFALACALFILSLAFPNPLSRLFSRPALRLPGIVSYSLYLWHVPIFFLVFHHLYPLDLDGPWAFIYMAALCGSLAMAIAFLSYLLIEKPFMARREVIKRPALENLPGRVPGTG